MRANENSREESEPSEGIQGTRDGKSLWEELPAHAWDCSGMAEPSSWEASWTKIKCTEAFPIQPGGKLSLQPVVHFTIWQEELESISIRGFASRSNKGKVGAGFSSRLLLPGQAGGFASVLSLPKSAAKSKPRGVFVSPQAGGFYSSYSQPGCSKSPFFWCVILENDSVGFALINNGDLRARSKSQQPSADPALGKGGTRATLGIQGEFQPPERQIRWGLLSKAAPCPRTYFTQYSAEQRGLCLLGA